MSVRLARHWDNAARGAVYGGRVAWDTEATRRALKEAAVVEFAERGLDGTTMARIAQRAGLNKERLYNYYGDKRSLWETVLGEQLEHLAATVASRGVGLDDIGAFAGATFDYHAEHPHLARLLQWEGLDRAPAADAERRAAHYRDKIAQVARAQRDGVLDDAVDPAHVLFSLIALAAWWQTVPQLSEMITGAPAGDPDGRARRRAFVVEAARRLTTRRADAGDEVGPTGA